MLPAGVGGSVAGSASPSGSDTGPAFVTTGPTKLDPPVVLEPPPRSVSGAVTVAWPVSAAASALVELTWSLPVPETETWPFPLTFGGRPFRSGRGAGGRGSVVDRFGGRG